MTSTPAAPRRVLDELEILIRARYPLIYVVSWEEQRVANRAGQIAHNLDKKVFEWSVTTGLVPAGRALQGTKNRDCATQDPLVALDQVIEHVDPALYIFKDFHPFMKNTNMAVVRRMREIATSLKNTYKTIIIVSPKFEIPEELEKDITIVDFPLPGEDELSVLLANIIDEIKNNPKLVIKSDSSTKEQIVHAMLGLTLNEAENVLARTLVQKRGLGPEGVEVILHEKKQIIRKNGLLEYYDTDETLNSVGGLASLKDWLIKRSVAFSDQARSFGLPAPKGLLLLGVQGCGKSMMAKAVSNIWKLPLLRFDVGRVFGSLVGSSEENIRRAIKVAESVCPAILWLDEIDKAFRFTKGSSANSDAGTSARVFGTFLTWLSEKKKPVFVISTANDVTVLPPELLRKGRFDEIFFVDLPALEERKEIFSVHMKKRNINPADFNLDTVAAAAQGYSGAEIEEVVISAMFDMFYTKKDMTTEKLLQCISDSVPLSRTMSEDMQQLRDWAKGRARPASNIPAVPLENSDKAEKTDSGQPSDSPN